MRTKHKTKKKTDWLGEKKKHVFGEKKKEEYIWELMTRNPAAYSSGMG
jgi:hypothetical protein